MALSLSFLAPLVVLPPLPLLSPVMNPASVASFARGLALNRWAHEEETRHSLFELGYTPASSPVRRRSPPKLIAYELPRNSLGFGRGGFGPFASGRLVFETRQPLVRSSVCAAIRREARRAMAAGASSSFTMTETNRDVPVHELPRTLRWLNAFLPAVLEPTVRQAYGDRAVDGWLRSLGRRRRGGRPSHAEGQGSGQRKERPAREAGTGGGDGAARSDGWRAESEEGRLLRRGGRAGSDGARGAVGELVVYRALVVQYDAAARLTHQPVHRDASLFSVIVPLNRRSEYQGGGTYIEALGKAIALPQGHALFHPSAVRHGGNRLTAGERWVLVIFLSTRRPRRVEHSRRFKDRARERGETGDLEGELTELRHALRLCPSDHELWYDAGAALHDAGRLQLARRYYERAISLNKLDAQPHNNLGALLLETGASPREALHQFRAAHIRDPHSAPAALNVASLLLALGRVTAAERFLNSLEESLDDNPDLEALRAEVTEKQNIT
jgi:tetratricopeptide (TPR) repeat protein